jgi:iron complex outermembrane receptor protein
VGAFWKNTDRVQTYATIAAKDRFPTLKDRFSLRFESYVANPDLRAEKSMNFDVGVRASLSSWLALEGAVFYADVTDLVQEMIVEDGNSQMQNIGKVRHSGVELSVYAKPAHRLEVGVYYTYLDRENVNEPEVKLRSTPKNRLTGFVKYSPIKQIYALASVECQDALWDSYTMRVGTSRETVYELLGGYTTANLTVAYRPTDAMTIDGGFSNALDRDYQQSIGFPRPGRAWFANAKYRF